MGEPGNNSKKTQLKVKLEFDTEDHISMLIMIMKFSTNYYALCHTIMWKYETAKSLEQFDEWSWKFKHRKS